MDELTEEGDVGKVSPYNRIKTRINDRIDHFKTDVAKVSQCLLVNLTAVNITQNNLEPFELIINCSLFIIPPPSLHQFSMSDIFSSICSYLIF